MFWLFAAIALGCVALLGGNRKLGDTVRALAAAVLVTSATAALTVAVFELTH